MKSGIQLKPANQNQESMLSDRFRHLPVGVELDNYVMNLLGWKYINGCCFDENLTPICVNLPLFSTNLNQAWKFVEYIESKIKDQPGDSELDYLRLESFGEGNYMASFGEYWWAKSTTPAHAICLACIEAHSALQELKKSK